MCGLTATCDLATYARGIYLLPDILLGIHIMNQATWTSMYHLGGYILLEGHCKKVLVLIVGQET